jgi:transketolase
VPTRRAFSEGLVEYASRDTDFWVFEADIGYSTYTYLFGDAYPDRYFNVGIAEAGMFAAAAGVAANGRTVLASSYGVFISMRAVEIIRSFICYPNLNVKILSSHGGITAAIDGVSHQATEDIAFMTTLPNMRVLCPADPVAARAVVETSFWNDGPVFNRLMRDPLYEIYSPGEKFPLGGSKTLRTGEDITIVSYGDMVFQALEAAGALSGDGIEAEVIDLYSIKPFDADTVLASIRKTGALLVAENHQARNGLGYELARFALVNHPVPFENLGLQDTFAESGDYYRLLEKYGLSRDHIVEAARRLVKRKRRA